jgi:hypothetical protein
VSINLVFSPSSTGEETYLGCEGDGYSVDVNGVTYDESNPTGTEILTNAAGCDSTVSINLVFSPSSTGEETYLGCEGDGYSVDVNGVTYDESNPTGTEILTNAAGCDSIVSINLVYEPLYNYCGTAFAQSTDSSTCFLDDGFDRWGWTNYFAEEGTYTMDLYLGAAQCDPDKGALAGNITVSYLGGELYVTYELNDGFIMNEAHVYVGCNPYPIHRKVATVAPGQYSFVSTFNDLSSYVVGPIDVSNLQDGIHVIVHAVVCDTYASYDTSLSGELVPHRKDRTIQCGSSKKSAIIVDNFNLEDEIELKVYPVPFDQELNISYKTSFESDMKIEIFNMTGALVRSFDDHILRQSNGVLNVNLSEIKSQALIIKLTTSEHVVTKRIISAKTR